MGYAGGERSFHKTAWGKQTAIGLAVPTTAYLAGDGSEIIALDRSPDSIAEDFGRLAESEAGRGSYGVRSATLTRHGVVRFEDIMPALGGAVAGGVVASGSGMDKTRLYTADMTSNSLDLATLEEGDDKTVFQMPDALLTELRLAFSDLAAPGNSPWTTQESWIGSDKIPVPGFTGAATMPASAETAMGHLTRAYMGSTGTAFAGLSEQVGLHACELILPTGVVARKYGDVNDVLSGYGRAKRQPTGTFTFFADAAAKAAVFDTYGAPGPVMGEKRIRISVRGSAIAGTNEQQTVTVTGSPTDGSFTLTFGAQTTGAIAYNASANDVQTALRALSTITEYGCVVTGTVGAYTVTFTGALANTDVAALTATATGLTPSGGVTIVSTVPGVAGVYKALLFDTRIRFTAVPVADANGATVYQAAAKMVYDSALGSDYAITLVNTIA
jgi:hypothetical protein